MRLINVNDSKGSSGPKGTTPTFLLCELGSSHFIFRKQRVISQIYERVESSLTIGKARMTGQKAQHQSASLWE